MDIDPFLLVLKNGELIFCENIENQKYIDNEFLVKSIE